MKKYIVIANIILVLGLLFAFYFLVSKITKLEYDNTILVQSNKKLEKALTETVELNKQVQKINEDTKNKVDIIKADKDFEKTLDINDEVSKQFNSKKL